MLQVHNLDDAEVGNEDNPLTKSIICILEPNTEIKEFLGNIPQDTEAVTLIQADDSGIPLKLYSSDLISLHSLKILEIKGRETFKNQLTYILDIPLKDLRYLSIENIIIEGHYNDLQQMMLIKRLQLQIEDTVPVIVPYQVYREQEQKKKLPIFKGNSNLILLRLHNCHLNELNFEMFESLTKLKFLYLDKNNIKIIPPFVFFGVPNLEILSLSKNHLLDINVSDLSGLLNLSYLDLSNNNFSQLSQLSFPPFPKLNLADFRNNPITVIYSNTFEIMNTTKAIVLGNTNSNLTIQLDLDDVFVGLYQLEILKIYQIKIKALNNLIFNNLINLVQLKLTGFIKHIEFDSFSKMIKLRQLFLSNSHIETISMDAFIGLNNLRVLDLSNNLLSSLHVGTFDSLKSIHEIYLNNNKFTQFIPNLFQGIQPKLIQLNNNQWDCNYCPSSFLINWNPAITNRIKKKIIIPCPECSYGRKTIVNKYIYDRRLAPTCSSPSYLNNKPVYQSFKKLQCKIDNQTDLSKINLAKKYYKYVAVAAKTASNHKKIYKSKKYYDNNNLDNSL